MLTLPLKSTQPSWITAISTGDKEGFKDVAKTHSFLLPRDQAGNTLLHLAVQAPRHALFMASQLLENHRANIHARNQGGETPLHIAVQQAVSRPLVRLLLAHSANGNALDNNEQSPLSMAIAQNNTLLIQQLTALHAVDLHKEQLQLRNDVINLLEPPNALIQLLNSLSIYREKFKGEIYNTLKRLQPLLQEPELLVAISEPSASKKKTRPHLRHASTSRKKRQSKSMTQGVTLVIDTINVMKSLLLKEDFTDKAFIIQQIDNVLVYYNQAITKQCAETLSPAIPTIRAHTGSLGYRHLSLAAAKRFTNFFQNTEAASYKSNRYGFHSVIQMNQTHYKVHPTAPGIEQAVHALGGLISGEAVAPTELIVLQQTLLNDNSKLIKKEVPVLASKTIKGTLFKDVLEQTPDAIHQIDPYNYSLQFLLALLTLPADGKPDNFMAKGDVRHLELVGIDNDESFAHPFFKVSPPSHIHIIKEPLMASQEITCKAFFSYFVVRVNDAWRVIYFSNKLIHNQLERIERPASDFNGLLIQLDKLENATEKNNQKQTEKAIRAIIKEHHDGIPGLGKHYLLLKTVIFCLPQMNASLDVVLRKQLLEQEPALLVIRWLKLLMLYNHAYDAKETAYHYQQETLTSVGLPLKLVPGTAITLYETLTKLQALLRKNPDAPHTDILAQCYPLVAHFYHDIRNRYPDDMIGANEELYEAPPVEDLSLTPQHQAILSRYNQTANAYVSGRTQTIEEACSALFSHLDFSTLTKAVQQQCLIQLMTDFPDIGSLTLHRCAALNRGLLNEFATHLKQLKRLEMRHCSNVSSQGLHALMHRFPQLNLTLAGYDQFEPHELLSMMQHCPQFNIILPDGSEHRILHSSFFLLKNGLKHNDIPLVTFLLLAGFHLSDATSHYSPLHEAIGQKNGALVEALIHYQGNINQYDATQSPLDRAYEILKQMGTNTQEQQSMITIIGLLLKAGALESNYPKEILDIGLHLLTKDSDNSALKKHLMHFGLSHNVLLPQHIAALIPAEITELNWQRIHRVGHELNDSLLHALITHLSTLKAFKQLTISGCTGVTQNHMQRLQAAGVEKIIIDLEQAISIRILIASPLSITKQTTELSINAAFLHGRMTVNQQFEQLIRALLSNRHQLTTLQITNATLTDEQFSKLILGLKNQFSLQQIELRGINLSGVTQSNNPQNQTKVQQLADALQHHPLISLKLDSNNISSHDAKCLADMALKLKRLTTLSLHGNPLGDKGIEFFKTVISQHPSLEELSFNETELTDLGFAAIVDDIVMNPALTKLDVGFNRLTEISANGLLEIIRLNQNLIDVRYYGADAQDALTQYVDVKAQELLRKNKQNQQQQRLLARYQNLFAQSRLQKKPDVPQSAPKPQLKKRVTIGERRRGPSITAALLRDTVKKQFRQKQGGQEMDAIIHQLEEVEQETQDKEEMIQEPLTYIAANQQQLDEAIHYSEQEQDKLKEDIHQLEGSGESAQQVIDTLKAQLALMDQQHQELWRRHERKAAQREAIEAFKQDKRLCLYYTSLHHKLEEIFIGCKALASNLMEASTGTLSDVGGALELGIELLGDTLSFIPGLGAIVKGAATALEEIDKRRVLNQAKYVSRLGSLPVLLKTAEQTARYMTEYYQQQILAIEDCEPISEKSSEKKQLFAKGRKKILQSKFKTELEDFADYAALKMFEALLDQKIEQGKSQYELSRQLIRTITKKASSPKPPKNKLKHELKKIKKMKTKLPLKIQEAIDSPIKTRHGDKWPLKEIYSRPGILTKEGRYFTNQESDPMRFGYRIGRTEEALALEMSEVAPIMNDPLLVYQSELPTLPTLATPRALSMPNVQTPTSEETSKIDKIEEENKALKSEVSEIKAMLMQMRAQPQGLQLPQVQQGQFSQLSSQSMGAQPQGLQRPPVQPSQPVSPPTGRPRISGQQRSLPQTPLQQNTRQCFWQRPQGTQIGGAQNLRQSQQTTDEQTTEAKKPAPIYS